MQTTLDLLDKYDARATFFALGKSVELAPELLREIPNQHEIASHGFEHKSINVQSSLELRRDIERSVGTLNRHFQRKIIGYRSPYASLERRSRHLLWILRDLKFTYDSSILPFQLPQNGMKKPPVRPYRISLTDPLVEDLASPIVEFPLSCAETLGIRVPTCGGFFLRLLGYSAAAKTITHLNKSGFPAIVYLHPWELSSKPKIQGVRNLTAFRIPCTGILRKLLTRFNFTSIEDFLQRSVSS